MSKDFDERQKNFASLMQTYLAAIPEENRLHLEGPGTDSLAAWFLGPRGENQKLFRELIERAVDANVEDRVRLYNDPPYVTDERKGPDYDSAVLKMKKEYEKLLDQLSGNVPFFSYRYQAHMNWDLTMPGMLGYFAAMLYNQNNVALEASPVTSQLEKLVGDDLCTMLGYDVSESSSPRAWGHITCDGSVANLEALWASRNLKYYPVSVKAALINEECLKDAKHITVEKCSGEEAELISLDPWELLNLGVDVILDLPARIQKMIPESACYAGAVEQYLLQTLGFDDFQEYVPGIPAPVLLGPATKHYSWPKNASLTGIGKQNFIDVEIDENARMDMMSLRKKLDERLSKKAPVLTVVAVLGSTEESSVDPLKDIISIRDEYNKKGMNFVIHVDAAWGGYFASTLRGTAVKENLAADSSLQKTPALELSDYVKEQYGAITCADSVTIDPHKSGYVPYPAGGLCYRNSAMRYLVAFLAPEVFHGSEIDANMGVFGVEGSKPGAAAAGVYLSHRIIRPDKTGYGKILGQALFNSKRFYAAVVTMALDRDDFIVVPVQQIPAEKQGGTKKEINQQLRQIKELIVDRENNDIINDEYAMSLLKQLGSDQIIITYGLNFKIKGQLNTDPDKANQFMQGIFDKLSFKPGLETKPELIVTTSEFDPAEYGEFFLKTYMRRLGLNSEELPVMKFISSTTMCPWLTATAEGNFIPTLITAFHNAIDEVLKKITTCN
jgi:glutamate/tyrosine decarboxylase-like PLP-dependent enzyme